MGSTGENIRFHRKRMNLTQEQLGKMVGVQKAAVQKWESGTVKNLKSDIIDALVEIFGISKSELLGGVWHNVPYNQNELKQGEVIDEAGLWFGKNAASILINFSHLNDAGQEKAVEFVEDLASIEKYRKEDE